MRRLAERRKILASTLSEARKRKRTRLRFLRGFDVTLANPDADAQADSSNCGVPANAALRGFGGAGRVTLYTSIALRPASPSAKSPVAPQYVNVPSPLFSTLKTCETHWLAFSGMK